MGIKIDLIFFLEGKLIGFGWDYSLICDITM